MNSPSTKAQPEQQDANKYQTLTTQKKQKYRHSESMKYKLKLVGLQAASVLSEKLELEAMKRKFENAEKTQVGEIVRLMNMLKYCRSTVLDKMSNSEWTAFFEKYFVRGETDLPSSSTEPDTKRIKIQNLKTEEGYNLDID